MASIFGVQYVSLLFFYKYPIETFHDMAHIFLHYTIIKECLTKQIIQEARMKTSLLRQQTTSGKDFEPPLLLFRCLWGDFLLILIKFSFQYVVAVYSQVPQIPNCQKQVFSF